LSYGKYQKRNKVPSNLTRLKTHGLLQKILTKFNKSRLLYTLVFFGISILLANVFFIYSEFKSNNPDPSATLTITLVSLIIVLIFLVFLIINKIPSVLLIFRKNRPKRISKLRNRVIFAFSLGAAIPTIIVAIFSTYFFNFGIQSWFDNKISQVLDQSITVGESYIDEHILQIKETAISISDDLNVMYYDLIHSPEVFTKVLNAQAEMRSLDEAIVFQKGSNAILAQTSLSFSLSFSTIASHLLARADKGEVVHINSDPTKIRVLIKLVDYNDTYLLIGRLVDPKIIEHIDNTNGAAREYFWLKNHIANLQVKFSMIFVCLAVILLLVAIIGGRNFAERLVKPIRDLVIAAEKVKNGDLTVQVPETGLPQDEIKILSSAFNRMVKQIDRQQKDLAIAQRAAAWSDVARKIAHEIKNPLTPIQLSAERLNRKFKQEVSDQIVFEKYTNNILKHSEDIRKIVAEFVQFARLPAPIYSSCEIVSVISNLIAARRLTNDDVKYIFDSNLPQFEFVCDVSQLNQVIINLLQNAEEAFEPNKSDKKIDIKLYASEDSLEIMVSDNGPGFSEQILNKAKESYITTKTTGTGLGLAIVEKIIQEHFGSVATSNLKYGGASVRLIFDAKELRSKLK
jgi:two-component system, NtrC family, nitrogen regulation sensor histidine kinase NtrY